MGYSVAVQFWSHSTSRAVEYIDPECKPQAKAIKIVNNWFDVSNSHRKYNKNKDSCAFGIHLHHQPKSLEKMENLLNNIFIPGKYSKLPFMKGMLVSIKSLRELIAEFQAEGMDYFFPSCIQTDPIENIFSQVRAMGNDPHPDPIACMQRINTLVLRTNRHAIIPASAPVKLLDTAEFIMANIADSVLTEVDVPAEAEVDPAEAEAAQELQRVSTATIISANHDYFTDPQKEAAQTLLSHSASFEENSAPKDGLSYVGGFLARKLIAAFPFLGKKTSDLQPGDFLATE